MTLACLSAREQVLDGVRETLDGRLRAADEEVEKLSLLLDQVLVCVYERERE